MKMRALIGVALLGSFALAIPVPEPTPETLLAAWHKQLERIQTLIVTATIEEHDLAFKTTDTFDATLWLLRQADGEVMARYERKSRGPNASTKAVLLRGRRIYLLNDGQKLATRFGIEEKYTPDWFRSWCPLAVLVDKDRAREHYKFEVTKEDETDTYLKVDTKAHPGSAPASVRHIELLTAQMVFPNKPTDRLPTGLPRQVWWMNLDRKIVWNIQSWQVNHKNGPTPKDFLPPESRPFWEVREVGWPWR
jgi:hypothetical protein